jgi:hypothetical protein
MKIEIKPNGKPTKKRPYKLNPGVKKKVKA